MPFLILIFFTLLFVYNFVRIGAKRLLEPLVVLDNNPDSAFVYLLRVECTRPKSAGFDCIVI